MAYDLQRWTRPLTTGPRTLTTGPRPLLSECDDMDFDLCCLTDVSVDNLNMGLSTLRKTHVNETMALLELMRITLPRNLTRHEYLGFSWI